MENQEYFYGCENYTEPKFYLSIFLNTKLEKIFKGIGNFITDFFWSGVDFYAEKYRKENS